jgi:DNA-binding NtrC family response regulator/tetratricopeptide (TPR) repeat protein
MSFTYESAARLFNEGEFFRLIELSGGNEQARIALQPRHRVTVANALALVGEFDEARRLAELDRGSPAAPAIRSQAEWTLGLVSWRTGHISSAMQHARMAVRLAHESADAERIAWALLHSFRLSIQCEPMDAIMAALPEVRKAVAHAGVSRASAYLHSCVAVLEGQTGRLDEARRHLDIAESLLHLAPNAWLAGLVQMDRGAVACHKCEFEVAYNHLRKAKEIARRIGYQQNTVAVDGTIGHLQFLVGEFDKSKRTLLTITNDSRVSTSVKLSALDTFARVHLALGELDQCEHVVTEINRHIADHPEVASIFHVRRAALVRAQLLAKKGSGDEALECLRTAQDIARQFHDTPLDAAAQLQMAQVFAKTRHYKAASRHLLEAERLEITTIRELQASYYYGAAAALRELETPLKQLLRKRALRLWAEQAVKSVRFEMDDAPSIRSHAQDQEEIKTCAVNNIECVADSFAAFSDLAHRPRLLGAEMLSAIEGLACSPDAKIVERRTNAELPDGANDTVVLRLGAYQGTNVTLVCKVPDDPVRAILLGDVLRIGRAAIELERAREEERSRAALWPAPPIEEQAGALFLAEEMQTILATARRVAPTTVPVLITGETGTGKEVVARTIHAYSNRASATFRPFNCSSVPKEMLDSQLFGHRKGSFTGASEHFPGVIRSAAGGTLFLDEIGETTLEVQPKLLRFLESNEVHPIGEVQAVRADVRIIAATNTDVDMLVAQGRFREDLFYRLNIVRLRLPPLRERRVEIPPLAHHYLQKHAQECGKGTLRLAEETMEYLVLYRWPGNVRQLANEMRRMAALAENDAVLMPEHLSGDIAASRRTVPASQRSLDPTEVVVRMDQPLSAAVQHLECAMIQHAMRMTGGRLEETAAMLGLSRKGLYLKRVRYGLESPDTAAGEVT